MARQWAKVWAQSDEALGVTAADRRAVQALHEELMDDVAEYL